MSLMRTYRRALGLSQSAFTAQLNVPLETYRPWDAAPPATPVPLTWASVPEDYDVQLKALRRHLDISQTGFARLVGAAGKAVVYQWEARKRTPSPLFWQRVHELQSGVHPPPVP